MKRASEEAVNPLREPLRDQLREPDALADVQRSGLARWSPRRWGLPALLEWWPAYVLLLVLALLAILVTARFLLDALAPFAHVILIAALGFVLTISLAPLVNRLERLIPRRAAVVIAFFGTLLVVLGFAAVMVWQLATEGQRLAGQLTGLVDILQGKDPVFVGTYGLPSNVQERLHDLFEPLAATVAERSAGFAIAFVSSLVDLVLILVITFYLLLDERRLRVALFRTFEPHRRPAVRRVFQEVSRVFGAYVRAQLLLALSIGVLVGIAMLALGVPYALFLAMFAGLAELIPMVGPVAGAIPALLVAATMPFPAILWVAAAFVVIQQLESNWLMPRLSGNAVGLHPIGSILALALGFEVGGVLGALFAVPIAGLLWVLVSTAIRAWRDKRIQLQRWARPPRRLRARSG
ncbi:MAG TPA: AI-2E family transporter [Candidatus Limnocylindria bacterium]|jgi:predicted PurR-regulated permease PerM